MAETNLELCSPRSFWDKEGDNYSTVHNADEATLYVLPGLFCPISHNYHKISDTFSIRRTVFGVDLTELSPPFYISEATFISPRSNAIATERSVFAVLVDGTDVPITEAGYGTFLGTSLGELLIPEGTNSYAGRSIPLNSLGRKLLEDNVGSIATFGLRVDNDISSIEPGFGKTKAEWQEFSSQVIAGDGYEAAYIHIVYSGTPYYGGYIWVEGTNLAYLDDFRDKRVCEGGLDAGTGVAGYLWVEGDYLHYIDASGNERYLLGQLTGLVGKVPGQLSINIASLGIKLCYIDSSGKERDILGLPA